MAEKKEVDRGKAISKPKKKRSQNKNPKDPENPNNLQNLQNSKNPKNTKDTKNAKKRNTEHPALHIIKHTPLKVSYPFDQPLEKRPILTIKGISKSFNKKLVLKEVNFEIDKGDIFGLIGMSGSGKTTLFQLMAGVINPTSGDVQVRRDILFEKNNPEKPDYVSVYNNQTRLRRKIGYASQMPSFYEHLTVEENLQLYGSLYGLKRKKIKERSAQLIKMVGLQEEKDTLASNLSGGMQRRLDVACAMIHEPEILFLDEPTSDLDPVMRRQLWNLIKEIHKQGKTVIIASHILEEVERLCSKIAILHGKKIVGYGSLEELKELFAGYQEIRIRVESQDYDNIMRRLRKEKLVIDRMFEKEGNLLLYTNRASKNLSKILRAIERIDEKIVSLDVSDAHLGEIFEMLARKQEEQ